MKNIKLSFSETSGIALIVLFLCIPTLSISQDLSDSTSLDQVNKNRSDTLEYYRIETSDGNTYMGQILVQDGKSIRVRTVNIGEITINTTNILRMERVDAERASSDDSRWFDYLQSSRYFYGPSGYGLKREMLTIKMSGSFSTSFL